MGSPIPLPSGGGLGGVQQGQSADNTQISQACQTGASANRQLDCEVVAVDNSLDGYWSDAFARSGQSFQKPRLNFFSGGVSTGCGSASSDVGPFYCPPDAEIYIDLDFFKELETRFGAQGGSFSRAYVIAHEYGHHIQNLLGTNGRVQAGDSGPTSGSVRLELQADCYAGVWAHNATTVPTSSGQPLIQDVNQDDVNAALDTASRIGDDFIQSNLGGGRVDQSQFTHGTSAQREKWWTTGYQSGDPAAVRHVRPGRQPGVTPSIGRHASTPSTSSVQSGRRNVSRDEQPHVLGEPAATGDDLGSVPAVAELFGHAQ